MNELHVILGAGQIGTLLAAHLAGQGKRVRVVRRGAGAVPIAGVEVMRGDLLDAAFAREVGRGASVVYQCTNPVYTVWPKELLPLTEGAITAAQENGARLVVLDCLYAYGKNTDMREDTPMAPCSKKGALRQRMADRYAEARRDGLSVTLVRASDFFGAAMDQSVLTNARNVERFLGGKSIEVVGDGNAPHAFTYGPDVARALARTAEIADAPFVVFVPTLAARPTREWIAALARQLSHAGTVSPIRGWMLRAVGIVWSMGRELGEMAYQFERPFLLDDAMSRKVLGFEPTPFEEQIESVATWISARAQSKAA